MIGLASVADSFALLWACVAVGVALSAAFVLYVIGAIVDDWTGGGPGGSGGVA
jgi:hypothetical protein